MERLWSRTWIYVGHASQVPQPGDFITADIAAQPVIMVRHTDGKVRVLMNRCAHKGTKVVYDFAGNTGKTFRCPYHAWTYRTDGSLLHIPLKDGYEETKLHETEAVGGLTPVTARDLPRLCLRPPRRRPRIPRILRRLALLDRQPRRPLARGRAGDRRRLPAASAQLQLEDVRGEPERHDAPDDRARLLGRHREETMGRQARGPAQADGDRAVRALRQRLQILRRHGRARLSPTATAFPASTSRSTPPIPRCRNTKPP